MGMAAGGEMDNASINEHIVGGNNIDLHYREALISRFRSIPNVWISLNIEETLAWLTKWSFDESHRQPIGLLGGVPAIAEFIKVSIELEYPFKSLLYINMYKVSIF